MIGGARSRPREQLRQQSEERREVNGEHPGNHEHEAGFEHSLAARRAGIEEPDAPSDRDKADKLDKRDRRRQGAAEKVADPSSRTSRSWKLLLPRSTPIMPVLSIVDAPISGGFSHSAMTALPGAAGRGVHSIGCGFHQLARGAEWRA